MVKEGNGNGLIMESVSLIFNLQPVKHCVGETTEREETLCIIPLSKQRGEGYQSEGVQI